MSEPEKTDINFAEEKDTPNILKNNAIAKYAPA